MTDNIPVSWGQHNASNKQVTAESYKTLIKNEINQPPGIRWKWDPFAWTGLGMP